MTQLSTPQRSDSPPALYSDDRDQDRVRHRAIMLIFVVHGMVSGTLATSLPWLQAHDRLSPTALGLVLFCAPIGSFIAMPTANRVAHRIGAARATRSLILLLCLLLPAPVLAGGPVLLFPAYLLLGMAAGGSDVMMNAQGVALERRSGRSVMSGLHGMWCLGSLVAGGAGILAAQLHLDLRLRLIVTSAVLVVGAWYAGRGLSPDTSGLGANDIGANGPDQNAPAPRRFALPTRAILGIGIAGFCGTFAEGATTSWSGVYVTKAVGAGPTVAAAAYTLFMLSMTATRLFGDVLVRRTGPVAAVRAGGIVAACGGVLVVLFRTPWPCMLGLALIGIGLAMNVPLVFSAAGRKGDSLGESVAGVATITYLSGLIAPAAIGWTAGAAGYPAAFALITVSAAALAVLAGALRTRPDRAPASAPVPGPAAPACL
ncbi:MFS transporter [Catenulispora sp. NF23]|uniref:MFS transporter n=1 Tax=Catenulispora pinistramenti TaxID=2705254 RepID=UPI001BA56FEB|nr:MFS transporter [Catenulispora pinistramenti]MBS2533092.1 MFS transporter [Catenulispora pinistramenti]